MEFKTYKAVWNVAAGAIVLGVVLVVGAVIAALVDGRKPPPPSNWPLPPQA